MFTKAVVEGLRSGAADRDGDGWISAEDLFAYVTSTVAGKGPQTPTSFSSGVQGKILLARAGQPQEHTDAQRREDLAALTRRLRDLEVRYSAIRDVLPSSDNRTRRLDEIIWEATAAGASADRLGELDRRTADFAAATTPHVSSPSAPCAAGAGCGTPTCPARRRDQHTPLRLRAVPRPGDRPGPGPEDERRAAT